MNRLFNVERPKQIFTLRDYQKEAVQSGIEFFQSEKHSNGIIVMPTGAGKSLIIASIAESLDGGTLVLQPNKEILEQNYNKTLDFGVDEDHVAVFSASMNRKEVGKITFATIGSIIKHLDRFDHVKNVIIDECHLVNAKGGEYERLIRHFGEKTLGLTATPYRLHASQNFTGDRMVQAKFLNRTRPRIFSEIVHVTQVQKLYELGFLAKTEYYEYEDYDHGQIKLNSTGMDFDDRALREYNKKSGLVKKVAGHIAEHQPKHTLVFCKFVEEAEELARDLKELGIEAASISSNANKAEREQLLADFRSGKIEVMANVGVLTTGFDFPAIDCVILARPTQSVALYYQMVGRGIRPHPKKDHLKLIDVCGNVARFGKIESFEIVEAHTRKPRLKSDRSYLTGFDFVSNRDMEHADSPAEIGDGKRRVHKMPFGKHKGEPIPKLPQGYLSWCLENLTDINADLREALENEQKRRREEPTPKTTAPEMEALPF